MSVNTYLVERDGEVALIDAGFPDQTQALVDALAACGVALADVDRVIYTHSHPDHMAGGLALADRLVNAEHVFWAHTTPALSDYDAYYHRLPAWSDWLGEHLPEGATRETLVRLFKSRKTKPSGPSFPRQHPLEFGEEVCVGSLRLRCVDGRGHDPFHAGWHSDDEGWFFTGDVLLRGPTPFLAMLRDDIAAYRATLSRWSTMQVARVFPGHGSTHDDFAGAVAHSQRHLQSHYERATETLEKGPAWIVEFVPGAMSDDVERQRRSFVGVCTMWSQLVDMQARGLVRLRDDMRWEAVRAFPTYQRYAEGE